MLAIPEIQKNILLSVKRFTCTGWLRYDYYDPVWIFFISILEFLHLCWGSVNCYIFSCIYTLGTPFFQFHNAMIINIVFLTNFHHLIYTLEQTESEIHSTPFLQAFRNFSGFYRPFRHWLVGFNRPEKGFADPIGIQYCNYSQTALAFVGHSDWLIGGV